MDAIDARTQGRYAGVHRAVRGRALCASRAVRRPSWPSTARCANRWTSSRQRYAEAEEAVKKWKENGENFGIRDHGTSERTYYRRQRKNDLKEEAAAITQPLENFGFTNAKKKSSDDDVLESLISTATSIPIDLLLLCARKQSSIRSNQPVLMRKKRT